MGDAYGLGPRIVLLAVFDCHHDVPPLGNGYNPRGGIGVEFAQVCTDNENILFSLEAVDGVGGWVHLHRVAARIALIRDEDLIWARCAVPGKLDGSALSNVTWHKINHSSSIDAVGPQHSTIPE